MVRFCAPLELAAPQRKFPGGEDCGQRQFSAKNQIFREAGFTYIGLMFAIAIAGIALAGVGVLWQMESRREKEKELLFVGEEYRRAIGSYFSKSPGGDAQYPEKLEDLLLDTRFPNPVRHLRRIYREPMMPDGQWELIRQQGRIIGVVSRSQEVPIKIAGFSPDQEDFESAVSYSEWRFISNGSTGSNGSNGQAGAPNTANPASGQGGTPGAVGNARATVGAAPAPAVAARIYSGRR